MVGVSWRFGSALDHGQLDNVVETLEALEPCIRSDAGGSQLTVGIDAPDRLAAGRSGLLAVRQALALVDPRGEPTGVDVMSELGQWSYTRRDLEA